VKTENPSAELPVVLSYVYKVSINSIIQSKIRLISHATTLNRDNIYHLIQQKRLSCVYTVNLYTLCDSHNKHH
jgi:hypothetical protein